MRSTPDPSDLTTQARIRSAAIGYIARHGFRAATVRAIAADAGVSAALVIHHFGSKDGLRKACDEYVLRQMDEAMTELQEGGASGALAQFGRMQELLPMAEYLIRALSEGGPRAQEMFDRVVDGTEKWLDAGASAGQLRASSDQRAMAKVLVAISFGLQLLRPYLVAGVPADEQSEAAVTLATGPLVELYTHGIFTDSSYLEAFRDLPDASAKGGHR